MSLNENPKFNREKPLNELKELILQAVRAKLQELLEDMGKPELPLQPAAASLETPAPQKNPEKNSFTPNTLEDPELRLIAKAESNFNPNVVGGLMQLEPIAIREIQRQNPGLNHKAEEVRRSPELSLKYARLYLDQLYGLAQNAPFSSLPEGEKRDLSHAMYNMGPTATQKLWTEWSCRSIDDFEARLREEAAKGSPSDPYWPGSSYPTRSKLKITADYIAKTRLTAGTT